MRRSAGRHEDPPFHHFRWALVESDDVAFLSDGVEKNVFPHLHLVPQMASRAADQHFEQVLFITDRRRVRIGDLDQRAVAKSERATRRRFLSLPSLDVLPETSGKRTLRTGNGRKLFRFHFLFGPLVRCSDGMMIDLRLPTARVDGIRRVLLVVRDRIDSRDVNSRFIVGETQRRRSNLILHRFVVSIRLFLDRI